MDKKVLTITVPSYNAKDYLDRCLSSMKQPEIMDALEVIIVNDGSTDQTAEVAQKYVDECPETYKLINKENGGHGSGVNTGILNATGTYFKVVDADDWVNEKEFAGYVELLKTQVQSECPADVIASDFLCVEDETFAPLRKIQATNREEQYGQVFTFDGWHPDKVIKMHSFTVKTSILNDHFRGLDEHCFYVDQEYITFPAPYIKSVYYDKRTLYMYRLGRKGQSMSLENMAKNKKMHLHVLGQLVKFYDEVKEQTPTENRIYLERCIGDMIDNQFQIYIMLGNQRGIREELKSWDLEMKHTHPLLYHATSKRSIELLRKTNYYLLPFAKKVHSIVKG